jgi:hypothetical protein
VVSGLQHLTSSAQKSPGKMLLLSRTLLLSLVHVCHNDKQHLYVHIYMHTYMHYMHMYTYMHGLHEYQPFGHNVTYVQHLHTYVHVHVWIDTYTYTDIHRLALFKREIHPLFCHTFRWQGSQDHCANHMTCASHHVTFAFRSHVCLQITIVFFPVCARYSSHHCTNEVFLYQCVLILTKEAGPGG